MRQWRGIWLRELGACFLSPIAYAMLALYLLLGSWTFWHAVQSHVGRAESLPSLLVLSAALWLPVLSALTTMRLFAEEKRQGTLEILMTAPVTEWQVVLGKYAGALSFVLLAMAPLFGMFFALCALAPAMPEPDVGALAGGALILALLASYCVAVGLFFSLLTRNQIVAAVGGFGGMVLPALGGHLLSYAPVGADRLIRLLAVEDHLMDFARGALDAKPAFLYVSAAALLLFFSSRALMLRRM